MLCDCSVYGVTATVLHVRISVTADIYQHVTTDLAAEAAQQIADFYSR